MKVSEESCTVHLTMKGPSWHLRTCSWRCTRGAPREQSRRMSPCSFSASPQNQTQQVRRSVKHSTTRTQGWLPSFRGAVSKWRMVSRTLAGWYTQQKEVTRVLSGAHTKELAIDNRIHGRIDNSSSASAQLTTALVYFVQRGSSLSCFIHVIARACYMSIQHFVQLTCALSHQKNQWI